MHDPSQVPPANTFTNDNVFRCVRAGMRVPIFLKPSR